MIDNNVIIANFNVTYGKEEAPLLEYFEDIVLPAFQSGIKRERKDDTDKYYFLNVRVIASEEDYVLTGQFVKETELEVKSLVVNNQLVRADNTYPTAPYSVFYIFLRNHRMVLIKNQKGSPNIKSFGLTASRILNQFVRNLNRDAAGTNKPPLPIPVVNVVGIPMREDLDELFKNVVKINRLVLRFYPLNGDLNLTPVTEAITKDIRVPAGANTGNITLNSCTNKEGVVDIIDGLQGVMEPSLNVDLEHAKGINIRNNELSEKTTWNLDEDDINNPEVVLPKAKEIKSLVVVSEDNLNIFLKFKDIIKKYII
jgi:hypothetical protein